MRVLIIEDETKTIKFLVKGLREEGHVVVSTQDGATGLETALHQQFDVIILDLMLPKVDGISICKSLRQNEVKTPIIMLTARESLENRIEGLDSGADDYLTKPFSFGELTARLRALARRPPEPSTSLKLGDLEIDLLARKSKFKDTKLDLSAKEFVLLQLFMRRAGHILSRSTIADSAWGHDFDTETNVIDVYITFLRKKLREATGSDWIKTHRGQGYSFEKPE